MSKPYGSRDLSEGFEQFLSGAARLLFWAGLLATVGAVGLLVFTCYRVTGDTKVAADAANNIDMFRKILVIGVVALSVGSGYLFWGEDVVAGLLVLFSAGMYFAPLYVPQLIGGNGPANPAAGDALSVIQTGGIILGILSVGTLFAELAVKVRQRVRIGVKADQLKYGKGIKEEADRQNVFMGNCWQLPYCRKFVRERCPIFHSKRTCWRERVGCMCEEEVIRNAMENKPIPKDALLAAKMIPQNFRLNEQQKIERCRSCVIYNEHQRHKYRLALPIVLMGFAVVYIGLHSSLIEMTRGLVQKVNNVVSGVAFTSVKIEAPTFFVEALLFVIVLVALSYALKLLEYCIFKLKI